MIQDEDKIKKFQYLRGPKKIERTTEEGFTYIFSEGGMSETDDLSLPGRTMLTSEGSVNRSTSLLKRRQSVPTINSKRSRVITMFPL